MDHRDVMRRMLATLAFRTRYAFHHAPEGFEDFEAGMDVRTPHQILAHMNNCVSGFNDFLNRREYAPLEETSFMETMEVFHQKLTELDKTLQDGELPDDEAVLKAFQGPLCDAMTHIGQIMMLRRLMGSAIPGTAYYLCDIKTGRVGPNQPLPEE